MVTKYKQHRESIIKNNLGSMSKHRKTKRRLMNSRPEKKTAETICKVCYRILRGKNGSLKMTISS